MFIKNLILVLIILYTASCELIDSDAGGLPLKSPKDPVVDGNFSLEETPESVLKKYFLEAVFSCSLWFQKGEKLDLELNPSQVFRWDLINDYSKEKEFSLIEIIDSTARVDIDAKLLRFDVLNVFINESGDDFKVAHNPLASLSFSYLISEKLSEIQTASSRNNTNRSFKHNDDSTIVIDNKRALEGELEHIFTYLKCKLESKKLINN